MSLVRVRYRYRVHGLHYLRVQLVPALQALEQRPGTQSTGYAEQQDNSPHNLIYKDHLEVSRSPI